MTLPSYAYGNPEGVASRKEEERARKERACGECRQRETAKWDGETIIFCGIKQQSYGRRCEHFRRKINRESE